MRYVVTTTSKAQLTHASNERATFDEAIELALGKMRVSIVNGVSEPHYVHAMNPKSEKPEWIQMCVVTLDGRVHHTWQDGRAEALRPRDEPLSKSGQNGEST